jgi:trehalose-6-phosphate synthase
MLLPALVRERCPDAPISFYLHSPFPSSELYRVLPVRENLLKGVLGADVLGFQIWDYSRHFISSCNRVLRAEDVETTHKMITYLGETGRRSKTSVIITPSGIEPDLYSDTLSMQSVKRQIDELREKFSGKKVIFGCDSLEASRGIVQKFEAYESFLASNTSWKKRVVLVQVCPKTAHAKGRENVEVHKRLCHQINELVGRINGKFGTPDYCPLIYLTSPPSFQTLCAFYHLADVYLLCSLRDGLNLGPSEYVACQVDRRGGPGVAIVSEFAGANQSLSGSIRINPWDFYQVSLALERALTMNLDERVEKHASSLTYVLHSTATAWGQSLIQELVRVRNFPIIFPYFLHLSSRDRRIRPARRTTAFLLQSNPRISLNVSIQLKRDY